MDAKATDHSRQEKYFFGKGVITLSTSPIREDLGTASHDRMPLFSILSILVNLLLVDLRIDGDDLLGAHQDSLLVLRGAAGATDEQQGHDPEHAKKDAYPATYRGQVPLVPTNRPQEKQQQQQKPYLERRQRYVLPTVRAS